MSTQKKALRRKRTITIDPSLDDQVDRYVKKRATEIIQSSGNIPSESQIIEELLRKGLERVSR